MISRRTAATLVLASLLGGCAASSGYPSLAPRPIETISLAEPAPRPARTSTTTEAAAVRYQPLIDRVRAADADFRSTLADQRSVVERGRTAAPGTDAWGLAQQAYSRLVAARGPVQEAVSALQAEAETPETQSDAELARAATAALAEAKAIDATEAEALAALAPRAP